MIIRAQSNNKFCGLISHIIDKGIAVLQYADDTIICLKHDIEGARNLKLLLYLYEMMTGLKINFLKSEVMTINDLENWNHVYADIFNCQVGFFPIQYLGVPVNPSRLHIVDWLPLIEKSNKKLDVWKGGTLSIAGRKTLIDSSLSNSPLYHMSIYLIPKTVVYKLDKIRRIFFWQGGGTKKKCHLVRWTKICKSKKKGGLEIKDIRKMNLSLMCKWFWKIDNGKGVRQHIVKHKYLKKDNISTVKHKQNDSSMWADRLKIRNLYLQGRKITIGNGKKALFWKDSWLYEQPICVLFPELCKMAQQQNATVAEAVLAPHNLSFSRWLVDKWLRQWNKIKADMAQIQLNDCDDLVSWRFGKHGAFTVKSMYDCLSVNESGPYHKEIWKSRIPNKIKNFLWLVVNNAILTKDNMIKRKWQGDPKCYFCSMDESVSHLLFQCNTTKAMWATFATCIGASDVPNSISQCWRWCEKWISGGKKFHTLGIAAIYWSIWKARNKLCFEGKLVKSPLSIICNACELMSQWAGLYPEEDKEMLINGADLMLKIAIKLLKEKKKKTEELQMLQEGSGGLSED